MPAKKKRMAVSQGDPEVEAARRRLFMRSVIFGVLVLVLMVVALTFVVSTLGRTPGENRVAISADVSLYTVKLMEVTAERRESAQMLLSQADLQALAGANKLYLRELPDGRIALCAGSFVSPESEEARALLARFRDYALQGKRWFASAQIWGYKPDRPQ